jgi:NAD(P)H-hydrate repair Nnr-like enzyme with NAD(P)H-hydrate dehydratase domain
VLTPHTREIATMLGRDPSAVEAERDSLARAFAREHRVTFVAKSAETLIADPDGRLFRNRRGTRGLGTAGSGDVLAGVVGGLLAQGLGPTAAAVWGVHLHALAGEAVARELGDDGMIATDLLTRLPRALRDLRGRSRRR